MTKNVYAGVALYTFFVYEEPLISAKENIRLQNKIPTPLSKNRKLVITYFST